MKIFKIFFRKGDAERALMYFNKAAAIMTEGNFEYSLFELFILRSQCFCKMGNFVDADRDAEYALNLDPHSVKGLVAKAEAQYNMGAFEHSLKYFYRWGIILLWKYFRKYIKTATTFS